MILNLPERVKQYELEALFSPVPGTVAVALMNSKYGGIARDGEKVAAGYLLMTSVEAAQGLMASAWKHDAYCRDKRMRLEYANEGLESSMIPKIFPYGKCWICTSCQVDNAPKRDMCVSCGSLRSLGCEFVDPKIPTRMLRITDIDRSLPEQEVEKIIHGSCPVKEVNFSTDRVTGHHKGTAYCRCFSIKDATKISDALNGRVLGNQGQLCLVEYCMERFSSRDKAPCKQEESISWEPAEFQTNKPHSIVDNTQDNMYIYDDTSGYYWHTKDQVWGTKDPVTGMFVPYIQADQPSSTVQHETVNISSAAVVSAKPQVSTTTTTVREKNKPKTVSGVIHTGTWANKKKHKAM